jgi:hypothetical protein
VLTLIHLESPGIPVIILTDNKDPKWFLKAVRDRARETEEKDLIQHIANAIGERRSRDLLDLVAGLELESSWTSVISYLRNAANFKYPTPVSFGNQETKVEPLKHREMIFELFSCDGLEPVAEETDSLLLSLEDAQSLAEASILLCQQLVDQAIEQVKAGDTLFFSTIEDDTQKKLLHNLLNRQRKNEIESLCLGSSKTGIDVTALWHTEYGRRALVDIGIKGNHTTADELDTVLSVLQLSQDKKNEIRANVKPTESMESLNEKIVIPHNHVYSTLLTSLIDQDLESLRKLGSTHSVSVLNALLAQSVKQYRSTESSDDYRIIVQCIDTHTTIRTLDSLTAFQTLADLKMPRIFTPTISALGNYFHESAAAMLISFVCNNRDQWVVDPCMNSLENILTKCPEAIRTLSSAVKSNCTNAGPLKRLLRKTPKKNQWYYK